MNEPASTTPAAPLSETPVPTQITAAEQAEGTTPAPSLREQATAKAHDIALAGKDKATEWLESLTSLADDMSSRMKEKLGDKYPDYLADMAGKMAVFAGELKAKDVEELVDDAREFVRKRPAMAVGAAAAAGFVLARLVKSGSGSNPSEDTTPSA